MTVTIETRKTAAGEVSFKQILVENAREFHEVVWAVKYPYGDRMMKGYYENPFVIQRRLSTGNEMFTVLQISGEDIGCLAMVKRAEVGVASIATLGVRAGWHRKGYGGVLLDYAIETMRGMGFRRLCANVPALNLPARMLFTSRRFLPEGLWRDLQGPGNDTIAYSFPLDRTSWPNPEDG